MNKKKKTTKRKRVSNRKKAIKISILVLIIAVLILAGIIALFRVRNFSVGQNLGYTKDQIVSASGLVAGKSMLTVDLDSAADKIEQQLPYIQDVVITKKFPSTLVINADKSKEVYAVILSDNLFAITNEETKILKVTDVFTDESIPVKGTLGSFNYTIGEKVLFANETETSTVRGALKEISDAITESEINNIDLISVEDNNNIYLIYNDRIIIRAGNTENLAKKLSLAKKSIDEEDKLSPTQYGVMNVTNEAKAIFTPGDYKDMTELIEFDESTTLTEDESQEDDGESDDESGEEDESDDEDGENYDEYDDYDE